MSNNDPRPDFGAAAAPVDEVEVKLPARESLEGKSVQEVAFELVKLNPSFSFAEATEKATSLVNLLPPTEELPPPVMDLTATKPVVEQPSASQEFQSSAEPTNLADNFPKAEAAPAPVIKPLDVEIKPKAPEVETHHQHVEPVEQPKTTAPVEQQAQPISPHIAQSPILKAQVDDDAPLDRDENQPNMATEKRRQVDYGTQPLRPEISALAENDPQRPIARSDELIGTPSPLAGEIEVMKFFTSIPRNRDGRPMFRSAAEEERYQKLFTALELTPPIMINGKAAFDIALEREDTSWQQTILLPNNKYVGPVTDRGASATGMVAALRRRRGTGSPVSVWLPCTGIYVDFRAPHENDMCDFDIRITSEMSKIGMYTYGLLLASSSGVYLQHMIEHSLKFAVATTYDCQGNDLKTTLMDIVDIDDYWLLAIGPLMAKFPAGIPWKLLCPNVECGHEREVRLNLARCIRMADGLLTDTHKAMWLRQRGTGESAVVANADYVAYRKALPQHKSATFTYPDLGTTIKFGRSTIGQFIDSTNDWVEKINESATGALAGHATETERSQYIRLTAEARRLTRYATHVKSITVEEEVNGQLIEQTETDPDKIYTALEELSSDRVFVLAFEDALSNYNEHARMAVFGYMGHACPSCGTGEGEADGPFRGIVTISPDKVFFALSRVVFGIQKVYLQQFESIG